jgi:hypothetical protein
VTSLPKPGPAGCVICEEPVPAPFLVIAGVPSLCNVLWNTEDQARSVLRGDLALVHCPECDHVFNAAFDPGLMQYTQAYENSLQFSPRFQTYALELADRLIGEYGVRDSVVIDVGCGKGDFLALLCERGGNRGYGFDPSFVPENLPEAAALRMTIVQDVYSSKYSGYGGSLVTCRHVLEHIHHPIHIVKDLRQTVEGRTDSVVFLEVPSVLYTLRDMGIWDLIYEHCSYFTLRSLSTLCNRSGFRVIRSSELYGGQFLGVDLKSSTGASEVVHDPSIDMGKLTREFAEKYRMKLARWDAQLEAMRRQGKNVVLWGGGSKGVTFLNVVRHAAHIRHVVDINPRKQGMYVSGAGQTVVSPDALRTIKPDTIIVMNALYEDEIRGMLDASGLQADIIQA